MLSLRILLCVLHSCLLPGLWCLGLNPSDGDIFVVVPVPVVPVEMNVKVITTEVRIVSSTGATRTGKTTNQSFRGGS